MPAEVASEKQSQGSKTGWPYITRTTTTHLGALHNHCSIWKAKPSIPGTISKVTLHGLVPVSALPDVGVTIYLRAHAHTAQLVP
ncbi:hypothetical protein HaLaN_00503, partial [Haematococcus lacustris]